MRNNPIPFLPTKLFSDTAAPPETATTTEAKAIFGNDDSTCWKTGQGMHFQEDTKKSRIPYVEHKHIEQFN